MNTISVDSSLYKEAEGYARLHNISISEVFTTAIKLLLDKVAAPKNEESSRYYISPEVKALECGFKCPEDISLDYKQEYTDYLTHKYL